MTADFYMYAQCQHYVQIWGYNVNIGKIMRTLKNKNKNKEFKFKTFNLNIVKKLF